MIRRHDWTTASIVSMLGILGAVGIVFSLAGEPLQDYWWVWLVMMAVGTAVIIKQGRMAGVWKEVVLRLVGETLVPLALGEAENQDAFRR